MSNSNLLPISIFFDYVLRPAFNNPINTISQQQTTEANYICNGHDKHPAVTGSSALWRDGCSWMVSMDADEDKIIIKAPASQSNSGAAQNIIPAEWLFLVKTGDRFEWSTDRV